MTYISADVPLITIAIVTYEQENDLFGCIDSVLMQDYPNIELIVCDDCSRVFDIKKLTDYIETHKKRNLKQYNLYRQAKNVGTVINCNTAISMANGEIIKTLAADDRLYGIDTIAFIGAQFHSHNISILAGRGRCYLKDGTPTEQYYPTQNEFIRMKCKGPDQLLKMLCTRPWSCILAPATAFHRNVFSQIGLFDTSYKYLEDWPFWIKACVSGIPIHICEQTLVWYRFGGISSLQERSAAAISAQRTFLRECQAVLQHEGMIQMQSTRNPWCILQCKLSIDILFMREAQTLDFREWSGIHKISFMGAHFPSLIYQKILGAVGNSRYLPWRFMGMFFIGGAFFASFFWISCPGVWSNIYLGIAIVCGILAAGYLLANGILWGINAYLERKYKLNKG